MTDTKLSKDEAMAVQRITMRAAWFPLLIMVIVGLVIIIPVIFAFGDPETIPPLTLAGAALVSTFVGVLAAAKFAVPKSLFKPRRGWQLAPRTADMFATYLWRWVGICIVAQIVFGILFLGLEEFGVKLGSSMNIISALMSIYLANQLIAQRMVNRGDATVKIVSEAR